MNNDGGHITAVYLAPVKALCSEKVRDWSAKFSALGLNVIELTGDTTNEEDVEATSGNNLIIATPEKWDSVSRRFFKNGVLNNIGLVLIDEVHLLNDKDRGHVLEAVVCRMRIVGCQPRYVAVSATIPNTQVR